MTSWRRHALVLASLLAVASSAHAHRLKVFATVEDAAVSGYGFFVGGGRPQGAIVIMRDAEGRDVWRGETDHDGRFSWSPGKPMALTVIIDARDGHIAEARIAADRFGAATDAAPPAPAEQHTAASPAVPDNSVGVWGGTPQELERIVDRAVNRAVERQVRPLLEAYESTSASLRFNDIMGGIGMIVGLAGMGMWLASRKRKRAGDNK